MKLFYIFYTLLLFGNIGATIDSNATQNSYATQSINQNKENLYTKDTWGAYYRGKKIKGADTSTFEILNYGYAKDKWNAYYKGEKIKGAATSSFQTTDKKGEAKDTWNTYMFGNKGKVSSNVTQLDEYYSKDS